MSSTPQPPNTTESLMKLTIPMLKEKAKTLGTPITGTKAKLVQMILQQYKIFNAEVRN